MTGRPDKPQRPEDFRLVYEGEPLLPFYAAEMLRPHVGKTVWVADAAGRTRRGILRTVPYLDEDAADSTDAVEYEDERPLYLRKIVAIAYYEPR